MSTEPFAPSPNPLARRLGNALGWLCVLATLALTAPGVALRASGEEAAGAATAGPAVPELVGPGCNVAKRSGESEVVYLGRVMDQLRADAARNEDPSNEVVPLDNRGFYYPVEPGSPPAAGSGR